MSSERPATPLDRALGTYLDHLTVERGLSTNTLLSYRRDLRRYLEFLSARGIADPGEVSESDVDAFVQVVIAGGLRDARVPGQAVHARPVAEPAQYPHCLTERTRRPEPFGAAV